jgi:hypothetical protein
MQQNTPVQQNTPRRNPTLTNNPTLKNVVDPFSNKRASKNSMYDAFSPVVSPKQQHGGFTKDNSLSNLSFGPQGTTPRMDKTHQMMSP